jgi:excinuclease ABC subunit C
MERDQPYPDLLMIDGGKGQLSSALAALDELGVEGVPVVGLAKRLEEIFRPGESAPLLLPKASASLRLLQVLRDEAHRFAVSYHRKLRGKRTLASDLDAVPGIGPKRRQALLREFGSIHRLRQADVEQIARVKGFSVQLARALKNHLSPDTATAGDRS